MNEKKLFNLIIALIIILSCATAYIIFNRQALAPKKDASDMVIASGTITCLPKTGTGNQTMECAIGLRDADDKHYALKNLSKYDTDNKFSVIGLKVKVKGTLRTEGRDNKYDIIGTIDVASIKEDKR